MPRVAHSRAVFRAAVFTVLVTMIAVAVGALVTTKDAGMAFRDWPQSDGENMLLFDWFGLLGGSISKENWDKFFEHGHRLAGVSIGLASILLVVVAWLRESRAWVRWLSVAILACVIGQGILGGVRVLMDKRYLAMLHGNFAAVVVSLMGFAAFASSRAWKNIAESRDEPQRRVFALKLFAILVPLMIYGQYVAGGMLRHLGLALWEHVAFACVVLLTVALAFVASARSGSRFLRRGGMWLLIAALLQVGIGLGTFATKYGVPWMGIVAVKDSIASVFFRTAHTVVGILLLMTGVLFTIRVQRWAWLHEPKRSAARTADNISGKAIGTAT